MELQRILAKDSRTAMEQVHTLYGKDALVAVSYTHLTLPTTPYV